jgi:hypothetical protein
MRFEKLALVALLFVVCACKAQGPMTAIANSHIEATAPKGELFDSYLKRDLTSYFCNDVSSCRVDYEYLRQGATQSGISYPKYYLWTKCFKQGQLKTEGAVRVAAIEQSHFEVTNFFTADEIIASPDKVKSVFPATLIDKILQKAKH